MALPFGMTLTRAGKGHSRLLSSLGNIALGSLLSAGLPLLLIAQVQDVGRSAAWPATLLLAVWAGIRLTIIIARGQPTLFDFFFWLFVYIFMGIGPTVQMRTDLIAGTTKGIDPALDVPTATLVWIGVGCYELGRLLAARRWHRGTPTSAPAVSITKVRASTTFALLAVGALASAWFVYKVGLGPLYGSRDERAAAGSLAWPDPAVRSIMGAIATYPLLIGIGALAQLRRRASPLVARRYLALMVITTSLLLLVVNPLSSARYSLGTVLFALSVFAGALATSRRVRVTLLATIGGFIFLFPLADAFRRPEIDLARDGFFGEYKGNPDYDAFWQIANSYSYVVDGLVEPGRQALGVVFFWVPRSLWTDKPVDTGILLANYRGYNFDNLSGPLWAELLVNGGVIALVVGFIVIGFVLRKMDVLVVPAFAATGFWAIVGSVFPVYMTILLRGSLLQATGVVAVATVCLLLVRDVRNPAVVAFQTRSDTPSPAPPRRLPY